LRFCIRPHTKLVAHKEEKFFFRSFNRRILVETSEAPLLQSLWTDLKRQKYLSDVSATEVRILELLAQEGLVEKIPDDFSWPEKMQEHPWRLLIEYLFSSPAAQMDALKKISAFQIQVVSSDKIHSKFSWKDGGMDLKTEAPFVLFFAHQEETSLIHEFTLKMRDQKKEWLPVLLNARGGHLGPFLGPSWKMCFHCVKQRQQENAAHPEHAALYEKSLEDQATHPLLFPYQLSSLEQLAQVEIIKSIVEKRQANHLLEVDLLAPHINSHAVWPSSSCECFYAWT
jgi:hypothetical protein